MNFIRVIAHVSFFLPKEWIFPFTFIASLHNVILTSMSVDITEEFSLGKRKTSREIFVLKSRGAPTFLSTKAFNCIHEAVVKSSVPPEARSLWPDVRPHSGVPEADFGRQAVRSMRFLAKRHISRDVRLHEAHSSLPRREGDKVGGGEG